MKEADTITAPTPKHRNKDNAFLFIIKVLALTAWDIFVVIAGAKLLTILILAEL